MKRQVREIVRQNFTRLRKGQSIIITVRPPALVSNYKTMESDILTSFRRLELFIDENITKDN